MHLVLSFFVLAVSPLAVSILMGASQAMGGISVDTPMSLEQDARVIEAGRSTGLVWISSLKEGCTGFLVAPDIVATAGHCVISNHGERVPCTDIKVNFDWQPTPDGKYQHSEPHNLYQCKSILATEFHGVFKNKPDYAFVQLDRPVKGRKVLRFQKHPIAVRTPLFVIGHSDGAGLKMMKQAQSQVSTISESTIEWLGSAHQGQSGGAVFNAETLEVMGILIGEIAYEYENKAGAFSSAEATQASVLMPAFSGLQNYRQNVSSIKSRQIKQAARSVAMVKLGTNKQCTGFLIAPNQIATAGHCLISDSGHKERCQDITVHFDWQPGELNLRSPAYYCNNIVTAIYKTDYNTPDYAIIELGRVVKNRRPLPLQAEPIHIGTPFFALAHTGASPLQYIKPKNPRISKITPTEIEWHAPAYKDESGSPVFNADTLKVIGVMGRRRFYQGSHIAAGATQVHAFKGLIKFSNTLER